MKIGQLAKSTGLTPKTIRFYESERLLPPPARTYGGYRTYGPEDVERVDFIRKAKRLGLSLDEIRSVLQLHDLRESTCGHVRSLLDAKLVQVEAALSDLRDFHRELSRLRESAGALEDCQPSGGRICGIIEDAGLKVSGRALAWIGPRPRPASSRR